MMLPSQGRAEEHERAHGSGDGRRERRAGPGQEGRQQLHEEPSLQGHGSRHVSGDGLCAV